MRKRLYILLMTIVCSAISVQAQYVTGIDENGNPTQIDPVTGEKVNFNPNNRDSLHNDKEVPKGVKAWTVDRHFGDITPTPLDTMPHLYQNSIYATGLHGEYNTIGNNYTARLSRIFIDRKPTSQFIFTDAYSFVRKEPEDFHFLNTLSPYTNISYDNCGNNQNGEDHIDAKFAVNANKRMGFGFDLDYHYARGYYQNQNVSHFKATLFASYIGDRYQLHALATSYQHKANENGGITKDNYITHPEQETTQYNEEEIPTVLNSNWNRNKSQHLFLTHRYNVGFYREVKMTEEEIETRMFGKDESARDSILAIVKKEYVPVTSFIHTLDINNYNHIYQAYATPTDYYANTYYDLSDDGTNGGVAMYDKHRYLSIKNTFGVALLEGFNKYMKAGLKVFVSYENRRFEQPQVEAGSTAYYLEKYTDHCLNIGGKLAKTQGNTFHFHAGAEIGMTGMDQGSLNLDFATDVNFRVLGDTVRLAAKAAFNRTQPTYFMKHFHSKHLWWDNSLDAETRTHLEGDFSYDKTDTHVRVAIDEIQNYTYFGMSYQPSEAVGKTRLTGNVYQESSNINVLTLQLQQNMHWGILNWDNVVTYQNSSMPSALPLPALNLFSNLYLKFRIARVLLVELGGNLTWFSKYEAPDYLPQISQFAIQKNGDAKVELGNYPYIDVYANMHLKRARFFVAMSHVNAKSGDKNYFLTPHYPTNTSIFRFGISWNFYN